MTRAAPAILAGLLLAGAPRGARADSMAIQTSKAAKALKRGDDAAALEAYSNALRLWTKKDGAKAKAALLSDRAAVHERGRDWDAALEDLAKALALQPKSPRLLHRRGKANLEKRETARALDDFYKAIALDINFRDAYFDRARAYELQGDAKFAREDYRAACRLGSKKACVILNPSLAQPKGKSGRTKPRPKKKVDFGACLASLEACAQEGGSYSNCVGRAETCGDDARSGCCPAACALSYKKLVDGGKSEAAAFRETFNLEAPCGGPPRADAVLDK